MLAKFAIDLFMDEALGIEIELSSYLSGFHGATNRKLPRPAVGFFDNVTVYSMPLCVERIGRFIMNKVAAGAGAPLAKR